MSTQVQSSLANLKASTAQLVGIIAGARHIPAGSVDVHLVLTKQVTTLLADIIRAHEKGEYIPGIVASCSKELMRLTAGSRPEVTYSFTFYRTILFSFFLLAIHIQTPL
ncbi:hypothetical protein C8R48DRAFT_677285 [Suillus tomentosus]|nr:hypothetical protein C8R48DRAFT_677285 [Suillus tomentosus]